MPNLALYKVKLLDEFEARTDEWTFGDFERRLTEVNRQTNYQDAKGIINAAHRQGRWPMTVKRYLLTNFSVFGNVSGEFNQTFDEVKASLTPQEKEQWKLNQQGV